MQPPSISIGPKKARPTARAQDQSVDDLGGGCRADREDGMRERAGLSRTAKQKPRGLANGAAGVDTTMPFSRKLMTRESQPGRLQAGLLASGSSSRRTFPFR